MDQNNNNTYYYEENDMNNNGTGGKKPSGMGKILALILCCSVLSCGVGAGGAIAYHNLTAGTAETEVEEEKTFENENHALSFASAEAPAELPASGTAVTTAKTSGKLMSAAEVYAANVNSTVGINTSVVTTNYFGYQTTSPVSGSGFIVTDDGYVVTNYHVIEDGTSVKVSMYDGTTYDAEIVGYDDSSDLAVLKINAHGLTPVTLGSSDATAVGDDVVAIGNPLGELTFSLTKGVISALKRDITLSSGVTMNLMQTDCAINAGNSGGALFNMYGEVIGITNAKYSSSGFSSEASIDNIGFAIPIDSVKSLIAGIIENGYASKPYIGVTVSTVSEDLTVYGVPEGASVQSVEKDSPAEKAGLAENDIITAVNGQKVTSSSELSAFIKRCVPGDTITLTVYRKGETIELKLTVAEKILSGNEAEETEEKQPEKESSEKSGSSGSPRNDTDPYGAFDFSDIFGDMFNGMFGY